MQVSDRIFVELMYESQMHPAKRWYFQGASRRVAIGRSADNDIVLSEPCVSRRHVEITRIGDAWHFESLGKNGCYADGQRIDRIPLWDGARVRLGQTGPILRFGFIYSPAGSPEAAQGGPAETLDLDSNRSETADARTVTAQQPNPTPAKQTISLGPARD